MSSGYSSNEEDGRDPSPDPEDKPRLPKTRQFIPPASVDTVAPAPLRPSPLGAGAPYTPALEAGEPEEGRAAQRGEGGLKATRALDFGTSPDASPASRGSKDGSPASRSKSRLIRGVRAISTVVHFRKPRREGDEP